MLSGWSCETVAYSHEEEGGFNLCRACLVKLLGKTHKHPLLAVQRLDAGLSKRVAGWMRTERFEIDEEAVENGYEFHERGEMDHPDPPVDADGEQAQTCLECAVVTCGECGTRLDTTPEQEAAAKAATEAAGRVFW